MGWEKNNQEKRREERILVPQLRGSVLKECIWRKRPRADVQQ